MKALPPLRYVDAVPVEQDGQPLISFSDPLGYVKTQVALSPAAYFIAILFDGERDVEGVQAEFAKQFDGAQVATEQIEEISTYLDEQGFLVSPNFERIKAEVEGAYLVLPARPAHLAGLSYPDDPHDLHLYLNDLFTRDGAPGTAPQSMPLDGTSPPLRCLISPHIDFERGGACYAQAYQRLIESGRPKTVFIFGVAHAAAPVPFILTRKHFDTPFGTVECATELVDELAAMCNWDPFAFEYTHAGEHSIEFQVLMLAYLYGPNVRIVPILCSMLCDDPRSSAPSDTPGVQRFLNKCNEIASRPELRTTVIAGADLAHVGKRFGDDFDIDDDIVEGVAARDREDLAHVLAAAPEAWHESVMRDENTRRVCGLGCIYSALKSVEGNTSDTELLHYAYAPDPAGGLVSFAGVAIR